MACLSKYLNLAGAGLCGVGGGLGIFAASGGTATAAAIIVTIGSIVWAISAYMDLAECLDAAGHHAEADAARQHAQGLQQDVDRLHQLVGV